MPRNEEGFRDGVDLLFFGATSRLNERKKERETSRRVPNTISIRKRMVHMHEKCMNM